MTASDHHATDGDAGSDVRDQGAEGTGRQFTRRATVDPSGRHALFSAPVDAARDQLGPGNRKGGREALYSTGPRQTGTVVVECSSCDGRTRATLVDLGLRLVSISVWLPGRRYSHWMRCPSCHDHTWCRIGWTE